MADVTFNSQVAGTRKKLVDMGDGTHAEVVSVAGGAKQAYTLLSGASATGPAVSGIQGGDYIWRVSGTFGGTTATLQQLDLDDTTWVNVRNAADTADVTATAAKSLGIGVGQGATMRVLITGGTGVSLNSALQGL